MSQIVEPSFVGTPKPSELIEGFKYGKLTKRSAKEITLGATISGYSFVESGFPVIVPNAQLGVAVEYTGEGFDHESAFLTPQQTAALEKANEYNPQRVKRRKYKTPLRVRRVTSHRSFGAANFMATYEGMSALQKGMYEKWKSPGVVAYFYNKVLVKPITRQIGGLVLNGDYKSPNSRLSNFDGAFKLLAFAGTEQVHHEILYVVPQIETGQFIHIIASGKTLKVPFNGDWADHSAQLQAIAVTINEVKWKNRLSNTEEALFIAEVAEVEGEKYLRVKSKEHRRNVEFKITITNNTTIKWKDFRGEVGGGIEIHEERMGNLAGSPIEIPYLRPNDLTGSRSAKADKVLDWWMDYALANQRLKDQEEVVNEDLVTYISGWNRLQLKQALRYSAKYSGSGKEFMDDLDMNIEVHPEMIGFETFTAEKGSNLLLGVDQITDITKVSTSEDWDKEEVKSKVDMALGMAWSRPHATVTNAMHVKDEFQELDDYSDQYTNAARKPEW